jgi:5-methylcytosine-specific restriction endonuclease McrA
MAWETSNRKARLPANWSLIRLRILRRDGYRCQAANRDGRAGKCLAPANQVDHIIAGDDHDSINLQALCAWHHARKSSNEGIEARKANGGYPSQWRAPEAHPLANIRKDG